MQRSDPHAIGAKHFGISEAKAHFAALLDDAMAGKTTVITRRGRPIPYLIPTEDARRERARLAAKRLRAMRGCLRLAPGETIRDLIYYVRRCRLAQRCA